MEKTNSAIPSRTGAPGPAGTVVFPDWVMLDRDGRTICHDDDATAAQEAVKNKSTAVEVHTASGHSGYFSFHLVDPPQVSYLDLHWRSVFPPAYPSVLAADENLVLLRIAIPNQPNYYKAPEDLFVYEAGPSPSLVRLPLYTSSARGLVGRKVFLVDNLAIGILQRADHYLVADLIISAAAREGCHSNGDKGNNDPMIAKLCVYYSKKKQWEVRTKKVNNSKFPIIWSTDNVLPFDGRFLCWVDYFRGVLLCDFSNRRDPMIHFVPFPGKKQYSDKVHTSKCYPDRFRSVSISQGIMCFVHIDNDWHEKVYMDENWDDECNEGVQSGSKMDDECNEGVRPSSKIDDEFNVGVQSGPKITIWTLKSDFNWEVHCEIDLGYLWRQTDYKKLGIPSCLPEFPIINLDDPDILYCLLREKEFGGTAWMIKINMKDKKVKLARKYVNENLSYIADMYVEAHRNSFSNAPLLATVFSKYLKKGLTGNQKL